MSKEYPLFPELSEAGEQEAQVLIDKFKKAITKVAEEAIEDLYTDIVCHISSDSWTNYRNELMDGFRDYDNRKVQGEHDFKEIRQAMLRIHKDEIIKDLNQDLLAEIESQKETIRFMRDVENRRPY